MSTIESQESTELDTITDLPTITVTEEDELDELEQTLALDLVSSDDERGATPGAESLPRDAEVKSVKSIGGRSAKAGAAIKNKVGKMVGRVTSLFHKESTPKRGESVASDMHGHAGGGQVAAQAAPEVDYQAQAALARMQDDLRRQEVKSQQELEKKQKELDKKAKELEKSECELKKQTEHAKKSADELIAKREAELKKEVEKVRKAEEARVKSIADAAKKKEMELAKRADEQEKRELDVKKREAEIAKREKELKDAEKRAQKERDDARKELEAAKKMAEKEAEMARKQAEKDAKDKEKLERKKEVSDEIAMAKAAEEAKEIDAKIREEKLQLEKGLGYKLDKSFKSATTGKKPTIGEEDSFENEEVACAVDHSFTEELTFRNFAAFNMGAR